MEKIKIELSEIEKKVLDGIIKYAEETKEGLIFRLAFSILQQNLKEQGEYINWPYLLAAKEHLVCLEILKPLSESKSRKFPMVYKVDLLDKEIVVAEKQVKQRKPREIKTKPQSKEEQQTLQLAVQSEKCPDGHPVAEKNDLFFALQQQLDSLKEQILKKEAELERLRTERKVLEDALSAFEKVLPLLS